MEARRGAVWIWGGIGIGATDDFGKMDDAVGVFFVLSRFLEVGVGPLPLSR
jgi:hypothetical protein